jgi:hypothetical protein
MQALGLVMKHLFSGDSEDFTGLGLKRKIKQEITKIM